MSFLTPTLSRRAGEGRVRVAVTAPAWRKALPAAERVARRAARAALAGGENFRSRREVSILLAGDARVRSLNRRYRRIDAPTNVLAFPAGPTPNIRGAPLLLGDVVVAFGVARAEARRAGTPLAHHLSHLVVHGILHLVGHDHRTQAEAGRMERLETRILSALGIPSPYGRR